MKNLHQVGKSPDKIDSLALATGDEKFADDFALDDSLHAVLLYSPHAHAEIASIDCTEALKVPGVVDILTHENVPRVLHSTAGQGYPEPSPYDALLFDKRVRFVGDRVALVAAESESAAREALDKIKVEYRLLEPLFDMEEAMNEGSPRIHVDDEHAKIPATYEPERNLCAEVKITFGDLDRGFNEADFIEEHTYRTQAVSHCAIELHTVKACFDGRGRMVIISSTQVPFHARRIVSRVLGIPLWMIRVIKPRIGGGFGGKQEVFLEPLVALVTWRHKRPCRVVLTRKEVFISSRTRHAMRIRLKTGVKQDGSISALEMDGLLNSGAYGTHALTVLSNVGAKVLPLFNKIENLKFHGRSVYTNLPVGGAFRGYGATQGYFAFNQQIDMIARRTGQDVLEYIKKWHIKEGETSGVFKALGEGKEGVSQTIRSCRLGECIDRGAEAIGWKEKRGKRLKTGIDSVRGVGMAVAMQGSGIPKIDMASASMKMNEDGSFNLFVGATDIGTGSDTILAQIAAEVLQVPVESIVVLSSDTDLTPFDTGAYASSTTYISGTAVQKCALEVLKQIFWTAARMLDRDIEQLSLDCGKVVDRKNGKELSFEEIAYHATYIEDQFQIQGHASHTSTQSPPPFIAQFAEVELDLKTGKVAVVKFVSVVDCGQPINPKLVEGQVEGSVLQGLGYALTEDYAIDSKGKMLNPRFWDYKIFTAADTPEMITIIVDSHEESGPFGAKSVGEIAINGPAPAIANAIFDASGIRLYELPMTPERVWKTLEEAVEG
jgi:putative selenate reductase molybdopterin-binding subunit